MDKQERMERYLAKSRWAQHHLDELQRSVKGLVDGESHRLFVDLDLEENELVVMSAANTWGLAEKWGLMAGDVAHNLRACLDHLVYQLACVGKDLRKPPKKTEFPIFYDACDFGKLGIPKIGALPKRDRDFIERSQPYDALHGIPERPKSHPLWRLHRLDIDDKHNFPTVVALVIHPRKITPRPHDLEIVGGGEIPKRLNQGAILTRYQIRQTGPNPKVEVEAESTVKVFLDERDRRRELIPSLIEMRDATDYILAFLADRFIDTPT